MSEEKKTILDLLGGRPTLERVHKTFYDKIYDHPWIGKFFEAIDQQHIENQQTDFMQGAFGGPKIYSGRLPIPAHEHMNITEDLFDLRNQLLKESLVENNVPKELQEKWLRVDNSFKGGILKKNLSECKKRYHTDTILDFPNPNKKVA